MYALRFDSTVCESCDTYDCLVRCQYLKLDLGAARSEKMKLINGEDSLVLYECTTCYGCEEYCPYNNHPFYHIVQLQEEKGILPAPKPIIDQQIKMYAPKGDPKAGDLSGEPFSLCLFPNFKGSIKGELFDNVSPIMGRDFFCNVVYLHYGNLSLIAQRAEQVIANIARLGVKELVCFHDECYGLYASLAPALGLEVPFRPVHFFEYLYNQLQAHQDRIKPLGLKLAYQRNCSTRLTPDKEHLLDDIFALIGVERVERQYDRENPLCCGTVFRMQGRDDLADDVQERNVRDMVDAGASACVFNCPMCYEALAEMTAKRGVKPIMIGDLCRMALNEKVDIRGVE